MTIVNVKLDLSIDELDGEGPVGEEEGVVDLTQLLPSLPLHLDPLIQYKWIKLKGQCHKILLSLFFKIMYIPILYIILFIQHIIQYILCLTLYISAAELSF